MHPENQSNRTNPTAQTRAPATTDATHASAASEASEVRQCRDHLYERRQALAAIEAALADHIKACESTPSANDGKKLGQLRADLEAAQLAEQHAVESYGKALAARDEAVRASDIARLEQHTQATGLNPFRERAAGTVAKVVQARKALAAVESEAAALVHQYGQARAELIERAQELGVPAPARIDYAKVFAADLARATGSSPADVVKEVFGLAPIPGVDPDVQLGALCAGQDVRRVKELLAELATARRVQSEISRRVSTLCTDIRRQAEAARKQPDKPIRTEAQVIADTPALEGLPVHDAALAALDAIERAPDVGAALRAGRAAVLAVSPRGLDGKPQTRSVHDKALEDFAAREHEIRGIRTELDQLGFGERAPGPRGPARHSMPWHTN